MSKALVASSKIKILHSLYKALAIPILCLCPPLSLEPDSPINVLVPEGSEFTNLFN